jgi:hypothetical protein
LRKLKLLGVLLATMAVIASSTVSPAIAAHWDYYADPWGECGWERHFQPGWGWYWWPQDDDPACHENWEHWDDDDEHWDDDDEDWDDDDEDWDDDDEDWDDDDEDWDD